MRKFLAIAASTAACAALLAISIPGKAEARRLYVGPRYAVHAVYHPGPGVPWYAVRAYYFGGPWAGTGGGGPYSWHGWPDYAAHNGIGCVPGTIVKGGDGIWYACQ